MIFSNHSGRGYCWIKSSGENTKYNQYFLCNFTLHKIQPYMEEGHSKINVKVGSIGKYLPPPLDPWKGKKYPDMIWKIMFGGGHTTNTLLWHAPHPVIISEHSLGWSIWEVFCYSFSCLICHYVVIYVSFHLNNMTDKYDWKLAGLPLFALRPWLFDL